jgi:hypothetical protein
MRRIILFLTRLGSDLDFGVCSLLRSNDDDDSPAFLFSDAGRFLFNCEPSCHFNNNPATIESQGMHSFVSSPCQNTPEQVIHPAPAPTPSHSPHMWSSPSSSLTRPLLLTRRCVSPPASRPFNIWPAMLGGICSFCFRPRSAQLRLSSADWRLTHEMQYHKWFIGDGFRVTTHNRRPETVEPLYSTLCRYWEAHRILTKCVKVALVLTMHRFNGKLCKGSMVRYSAEESRRIAMAPTTRIMKPSQNVESNQTPHGVTFTTVILPDVTL